jgi:glucose-1-phosphatase
MPESVAALLFDLGRVVIDVNMAHAIARWAELAGVPAAVIAERHARRVAGGELFCRHERGEISDAAFFAHLRAELQIALTDDELNDGWNALLVGEMPGIRPLLSRAQATVPLFAFSNTNSAHQRYWSLRFADLLAPFRKIYASHELGARKPERRRSRPWWRTLASPPSAYCSSMTPPRMWRAPELAGSPPCRSPPSPTSSAPSPRSSPVDEPP